MSLVPRREVTAMPMRTHELHPMLIHSPLVLLPAAAVIEIRAATERGIVKRRILDRMSRGLWWGVAGSGLFAGLAGMAAAKEIAPEDPVVNDAMWMHGMGNLTLVVAAAGLAAWRSGHRPSATTAALGAGAVTASLYTAWLGGSLVYTHGAGVKGAGAVHDAPALLSGEGVVRLAKDAVGGLTWLFRHAADLARGRAKLHLREIAPGSEAMSGDPATTMGRERTPGAALPRDDARGAGVPADRPFA